MLLKIDQEFKNLIPPLTHEERTGLENNIKANGCETPITVWDGTIIDGHNRYEICIDNGIHFEIKEINFTDRADAKIWIIKHELEWKGRRILPYTRTSMVLQMKDIIAKKAKANLVKAGELFGEKHPKEPLENSPNPLEPIDTRQELAKLADVSDNTVARVELIEEKATEEQKQALREGKKSINEAYIEVKKQEIQKQEEEDRKQRKLEIQQQEEELRKQKELKKSISSELEIKESKESKTNQTCTYKPTSILDKITLCPCGCGYGIYSVFATEKDKWYSKDEINKIKEINI